MRTKDKKPKRSLRERARKHAAERKGGNRNLELPEGTEMFKAKKEKEAARLDIIPYVVSKKGLSYADPGDLWYEKTYYTHWNLGADGKKGCVCPTTVGEACPVCEYIQKLRQQASPENEEVIEKIKRKQRQLFNVRDRRDTEKGTQVFEVSYYNFGQELEKEIGENEDENPEYAGFSDILDGFTLKIRWDEEKIGGTKFLSAGRIDFIERKKPLKESVIDTAVDFDKALVIPSYKEVKQMLNGIEEGDTADEDEEEDDSFAADKENYDKRDRKKAKTEIEDDDDEDEDDDEEEEEVTSRKKKKKAKKSPKKKAPPSEDDDDDDEDWDDDDEEEDDDE